MNQIKEERMVEKNTELYIDLLRVQQCNPEIMDALKVIKRTQINIQCLIEGRKKTMLDKAKAIHLL